MKNIIIPFTLTLCILFVTSCTNTDTPSRTPLTPSPAPMTHSTPRPTSTPSPQAFSPELTHSQEGTQSPVIPEETNALIPSPSPEKTEDPTSLPAPAQTSPIPSPDSEGAFILIPNATIMPELIP